MINKFLKEAHKQIHLPFQRKPMQESKEILPHITTKEELDALYKKNNKDREDLSDNQEKQKNDA